MGAVSSRGHLRLWVTLVMPHRPCSWLWYVCLVGSRKGKRDRKRQRWKCKKQRKLWGIKRGRKERRDVFTCCHPKIHCSAAAQPRCGSVDTSRLTAHPAVHLGVVSTLRVGHVTHQLKYSYKLCVIVAGGKPNFMGAPLNLFCCSHPFPHPEMCPGPRLLLTPEWCGLWVPVG